MERVPKHLDSRRIENGDNQRYVDYFIRLDDSEAVESSPFHQALEALREFGLTELTIGVEDKETMRGWNVYGFRKFQGTEPMVADHLGGELTVFACITGSGERQLEFAFGDGDYVQFDSDDLNEMIWSYLEVIHTTLSRSWEGRNIPFTFSMNEQV